MKNQKGYIILISVIVISIILMAVALALSGNVFSIRSNMLDAEFKKTSKGLAEACAETALLKLKQNNTYDGNENIAVGNQQCSILAIETEGNQKIIKTTANFQNFVSNIKVIAVLPDASIASWQEVANF